MLNPDRHSNESPRMAANDEVQIAVLDDYQMSRLRGRLVVLRDRADIAVFQDHSPLRTRDERLQPFDVVCVMRERSPLPRNVIDRLPNLKLIASTGSGNASIDVAAASEHGSQWFTRV